MTATRKRLIAATLLLAAVTLGCNPLTMPFFMAFGVQEKVPPDFPLANPPEDPNDPPSKSLRKQPPKVVVLVTAPVGSKIDPEFRGIDRTLTSQFVQRLLEDCRVNKETVLVIPHSAVDKFKQNNPSWKSLSAKEIGQRLNADYVIEMEVRAMGMYEPGSRHSLYRGQAQISVSVTDTHRASDEPVFQREYDGQYPRTNPEMADTSPEVFKQKFLGFVVTDLVWMFTAHQSEDQYHRDQ
jgi:hypothetical protein